MRYLLFTFLGIMLGTVLHAQYSRDSLLEVLDAVIQERPAYAAKKNNRLDSLKGMLLEKAPNHEHFSIYSQLLLEYKNYNLDSALKVAKLKSQMATELRHVNLQNEAYMNIAEVLGKMGMYKEAFDKIDSVQRATFNTGLWKYYYHLHHSIYSLLYENALSQEEKQTHQRQMFTYKDSLLAVNDSSTLTYQLIANSRLVAGGAYQKALKALLSSYQHLAVADPEMGTLAYVISTIYEKEGNISEQIRYLAISAIADLTRAVKSYIALRKLAIVLYGEGDLERAYAYIKCSMEDASFAKARFRIIEISEALPIITAAYDKQMQKEKRNLFKYLVLISIMSVVLLSCVLFIYRQLKKISAAKKLVKKANEELLHINQSLTDLNKKLAESDHVKEVYIGYVFNLCSSYIDKLENYRATLHKKLKEKDYDEALRITGGSGLVTKELKEFFQNFDAIFLQIFPGFVEEFNSLLKEGEQLVPKSGDLLTPELRVFALIRLGVTDSSKIAEFLHYSSQTVYNYKLKVKNKLAVTKEDFSEKIQVLGK